MRKTMLIIMLTTSALVPRPASASDTRLIVYESWSASNPDVWVMHADGSQQRPLTTDPAADQGPVWSPDGSQIAFLSYRDGDAEIFTMSSDGSEVTQLTFNTSFDGYPVWGPTDRIAFISNRSSGSSTEIWTMRPDGSGLERLTRNTWADGYPAWTPDGRLLFASAPPIERTNGRLSSYNEIFRMNADGTDVVQLTSNICEDHAPSASPDGTQIAFASDCNRAFTGVSVMDADGSDVRALTNNAEYEDWPTWSPDGTQVVYASTRDVGVVAGGDIVVMNADGSAPHNLTRTVDVFEGLPWFAPSGTNDEIGRGHIAIGHAFADLRSVTVVSESIERSADTVVDEGVDGFFLQAPPAGTRIRTVTTDHGGRGFVLNLNFHTAARVWITSCSPAWFIGQADLRVEVLDCVVPSGAATVEVSADHGIDLDVSVLARS